MGFALNLLGWLVKLAVLAAILLVMSSCTMLGLNYASLETDNKPEAVPPITASSLAEWEAGRDSLVRTFDEYIYGPWPDGLGVELVERRMVDEAFAGGTGTLEDLAIRIGDGEGAQVFHVALAIPDVSAPAPLIISQTFGGNCGAFPGAAITGTDGQNCATSGSDMPGWVPRIFGEYIALVPIEQYFERGYAYATWQASDLVPDETASARQVMAGLTTGDSPAPTGTIAAWGYGFSAIIDVLENDPRLDQDRIAALGHSRHAKSAMEAAVHDRRISAVVAHQSGFGGAASSRSRSGETVDRMINGARAFLIMKLEGYPHWFDPTYADYADHTENLPVDQHQFIGLVAPTPLFLGNGRRDVWSDPNSTYRMAVAADKVYELYDTEGLNQKGMQDFAPGAPLSYYIRPGGHSIVQRDITAFMDFLDNAMPQRNRVPMEANAVSVSPNN